MFLEVRDLSFGYGKTPLPSLSGLSFSVMEGEIVGLVGVSGSGKSTLLRLIAGLERPFEGSIQIAGNVFCDIGRKLWTAPEHRRVGMLFQDYGLFPHMTVEKNILFGLKDHPRETRKNRMQAMLGLVEMEAYASRYPYELSGGQQQRVALARALAPSPKLLLLDEPFSSLDESLKENVRCETQSVLSREKITCLFVSHDRRDVEAVCGRVLGEA